MKKTIMLDMDDVISGGDTSGFAKMIEDFLGKKINFTETGYYLQDALGTQKEEFFEKRFINHNIYDGEELFPSCYEVLEKLNKKYTIYVVTSWVWDDAIENNGNILKYKFEYLRKNLPFLDYHNFIFIQDKSLIHFDIRIDDKLSNLICDSSLKILYDSYHNKNITDEELKKYNVIRVKSWKDIASVLLEEEN